MHTFVRIFAGLVAVFIAVALSPVSALGATLVPGDTALPFGTSGRITTPIGNGTASVVVQPDGKVVSVDYAVAAGAVQVRRFTKTGGVDTSFGGGTGRVGVPIGGGYATSIVRHSTGRVYVSLMDVGTCTAKVARITSTGALDTTWNAFGAVPGVATTGAIACALSNYPLMSRLIVQSSGAAIVTVARFAGADFDAQIYGFDANGLPGGNNNDSLGGSNEIVNDAIEVGTRILLVGSSTVSENSGSPAFIPADRNSYATTFETATFGGISRTSVDRSGITKGDELRAAVKLADGTVGVVGMRDNADAPTSHQELFTAKISIDAVTGAPTLGSTIASYNPTSVGLFALRAERIVRDSQGRYLVVGHADDGDGPTQIFVMRLRANMTIDPTFNQGRPKLVPSITNLGGLFFNIRPAGVATAPDGTIVVAGTAFDANPTITRLHSSLVNLDLIAPRSGRGAVNTRVAATIRLRSTGPDVARRAKVTIVAPRGIRIARVTLGSRTCRVSRSRYVSCPASYIPVGNIRTLRVVAIPTSARRYTLRPRVTISDTDRRNASRLLDSWPMYVRGT